MKFTVDQNDACIRFVAPQVVLFYAAPPVLALQPEHACMTLTLLCNHHIIHMTGHRRWHRRWNRAREV